ncbi:zinc finger protein JAGGED isoform X2 [Carica papaya]|uniref:zinc finger protein JAGGED isoform X2 n=1 Tax=Carica papaya TaxID=3649 RepID=UPI000B8C7616|nr:zinc finger protein JAGGED isoform X2 [Carica papaya]
MRPERNVNPLDLNNFPDDFARDGYRKKKSGAKDGKDECGKVYECRFCSLKFCKSQALGGHMNRHRQERETETLNRARQLVFNNDNFAAQGTPHLGYHGAGPIGDQTLYRAVYAPRLFPGSSSTVLPPPPPQPYLYPSPSRLTSYHAQYPQHPAVNHDYYVGHVLSGGSSSSSHQNLNYMGASAAPESSYTCIGAPVGHGGFNPGPIRGSEMAGSLVGGGGDGSLSNQEETLSWGRSYAAGGSSQHRNLDPPPSINRFQDGF